MTLNSIGPFTHTTWLKLSRFGMCISASTRKPANMAKPHWLCKRKRLIKLVCVVTKQVCRAMVEILLSKYIRFPTNENLKEVIDGFKHKFGFPVCWSR